MVETGNFLKRFSDWRAPSYLVLVFAMVTPVFAQEPDDIKVTATVANPTVTVGMPFDLYVNITSSKTVKVDEPKFPAAIDNATFEGTPSTTYSSQTQITGNGVEFQSTRTYIYSLRPNGPGVIKIPAVEVIVNGTPKKTTAFQVNAVQGHVPGNPPTAPRQLGGPRGRPPIPDFDDEDMDLFSQLLQRRQIPGYRSQPINPDEAFFLQIDLDKTTAYAGEQVTATWFLYTRGLAREFDVLKYPALKGFWKEDIELATALNYQAEVVNGVPYRKALIASYALFPIKAGKLNVDSMKAKASIIMDNGIGIGFGRAYDFTKASQDIAVKVLELPTEGKPTDFNGAVGSFDISVQMDQKTAPVDQPVLLRIQFKGRGNAKLIDLPPMDLPQGLELYDVKKDGKFFKDGTSVKNFEVLVIPREPGTVKIPSISFSMFDPQKKAYYQRKTPEISFEVTGQKSAGGQQASNPSAPAVAAAKEVPWSPQITLAWSSSKIGSTARAIIWSFVVAALAIALLLKARWELLSDHREKDLRKELHSKLKKIDRLVGKSQWRMAGREMINSIYFIFGALSGQGGADRQLEALLQLCPPSVRNQVGTPLKDLLVQLEIVAFAPDELIGDKHNPQQVKKMRDSLRDLLLRAVDLGMTGASPS